jgi:hypothetical protein
MANFYSYVLKAGVELQASVPGKLIVVDNVTAATGVDITPMLNNATGRTMPGRKKGFKCWTDYDAIILKAATDCTVSLFLSTTDVSLGFTDGSSVNVAGSVAITNDGTSRVPVDLANGTVNVNAVNVGINNTDANPVPVRLQAMKTLVALAPKVYGPGAAAGLVNDATLLRLRVRNNSVAGLLAIGGADVTLANAAIILKPGEMWVEEDAAGAAWYACTDTAGTEARIMGVKG